METSQYRGNIAVSIQSVHEEGRKKISQYSRKEIRKEERDKSQYMRKEGMRPISTGGRKEGRRPVSTVRKEVNRRKEDLVVSIPAVESARSLVSSVECWSVVVTREAGSQVDVRG